MSQQQHMKPEEEAIRYGDVFDIQGELAEKLVAPKDAAMMQIAENALLGETNKDCAAAAMESAAMMNERAGFVGPDDVNVHSAVTVEETHLDGKRIITESIDDKVIGKYSQEVPLSYSASGPSGGSRSLITIGEALEAAALTAGTKSVDWSDAAAIQAAEVRATGRSNIIPGGVAAAAQSAATHNANAIREEDKIKLSDILSNAMEKLPSDNTVTKDIAEEVSVAEMRCDQTFTARPVGVAASLATAARLNNKTTN
ncbi:Late embryoproteinsis abundant protein D-34 [Hibiscus syriacus]|uniref:Late embryoproteinsis abundant protein D-34 n=1 Tax=Hibiscus syriacus TaxID=106335 RepID=A0A6A2XUI3_HIBSY|nr:late embryogenesis abundant protein D-34-like [Hibiscus syriacus]KAE8679302.1 Late embryoproteinsis abundant protein D-34 [Hibiscus syriacus]